MEILSYIFPSSSPSSMLSFVMTFGLRSSFVGRGLIFYGQIKGSLIQGEESNNESSR